MEIELDLVHLHAAVVNSASPFLLSGNAFLVTTSHLANKPTFLDCSSNPPSTCLYTYGEYIWEFSSAITRMRRSLLLFFRYSSASSSYAGARITSTKRPFRYSEASSVNFVLVQIMLPNAETGSQSHAASIADLRVFPVASPQGLLCFTIDTAIAPPSSRTEFSALSMST